MWNNAKRLPIEMVTISKLENWLANTSQEGECTVYNGTKTHGYAFVKLPRDNKLYLHRLIYAVSRGMENIDGVIDHKCRNTKCVRLSHLEKVTHLENTRRGNSGKANSSKTHCILGHEFTEENTRYANNRRHRYCRKCQALAMRNHRARLRTQTDQYTPIQPAVTPIGKEF